MFEHKAYSLEQQIRPIPKARAITVAGSIVIASFFWSRPVLKAFWPGQGLRIIDVAVFRTDIA